MSNRSIASAIRDSYQSYERYETYEAEEQCAEKESMFKAVEIGNPTC